MREPFQPTTSQPLQLAAHIKITKKNLLSIMIFARAFACAHKTSDAKN